ncbi:MAG: bifunctional diaminohydroxyphosphoribosylaminopyrimidine deaminase/5-amino-6-(5-phosphoribosylamino)uracil reductase RibD [Syntrophales bacterium]|nr:bifunctional diaminohydroxyphosphoribosylaminopyrimidine deaminase/5-amino-6-(5-phosphoribosylamino)uracil reductase RibD [Syntrophales bacterium]
MDDKFYMRRALKLAKKGEGRVSPNPMVGAVIVRDCRIIGEGWHACCGENHAEINAIENAKESVVGATMYVTLEPCSHQGRTPPCAKRLIAEKFARVVVGTVDPNPLVAGRGIRALKKAGISVTAGILEEACRQSNEKFFKFISTGLPFVTIKFAQTLDGRLATATGHSRWISSPPSLRMAHTLRSTHDAILIGAGTVLADDPELTVRLAKGRNPLRIILDGSLRTPLTAKVLRNQDRARTVIVTSPEAPDNKVETLHEMGIEILCVDQTAGGQTDLRKLLRALADRDITSILVEGGATVITSFIKEKLVDRLVIIVAPKIVGKGIEAIGDLGIRSMDDAILFPQYRALRKGDDIIYDIRMSPTDHK